MQNIFYRIQKLSDFYILIYLESIGKAVFKKKEWKEINI